MTDIKISKALISVFNKEGLDPIIHKLHDLGVELLSTGGTQEYIMSLGVPCTAVEDLTNYPSILGGRVKTLHPQIFGGILARRDNPEDRRHCEMYEIDPIDLVVVDLYPFEETIACGASHEEIIEKIDIGGVSLIRAAAKNYRDVTIIPSRAYYPDLLTILTEGQGITSLDTRQHLAHMAFGHTTRYDGAVAKFFDGLDNSPEATDKIQLEYHGHTALRYGENPHQKASLYGNAIGERFTTLHGKQISYNNLLDIDAATHLVEEFDDPAVAIVKHNTPCGVAVRDQILAAYEAALACDPVSAFGGIVVLNRPVALETAQALHKLFIEVLIAPAYDDDALALLKEKKNRIIIQDHKGSDESQYVYRTLLGDLLMQERDQYREGLQDLKDVTAVVATDSERSDMLFGMKVVKYCKSNAIVLVRDQQVLGAGYGQTSRVDALRHAIEKARAMGFDLTGAVLASDAFFPFSDCVEMAHGAGIHAIVQPGGSVRDSESIAACDRHGMAMTMTGIRHFRH